MARSSINRVILTGNLTADPDLRTLPSGTIVCRMRIASNTRRKDAATGEWIDNPTTSTSPCGALKVRTARAT